MRKAVLWAAAGLGLAAAALALVLSLGFRFSVVVTPSMGQTAPVGTLVVTHPAETYTTGDIISFDRGTRLYTHRIVEVNPDGTFSTKGDLNGAKDGWAVPSSDVVGKAVWVAPGLGWLLRGLPWLALGFITVYLLSLIPQLSRPWLWSVRISGWTLVVALVAFWLRPWVNAEMLTYRPADTGGGVLMHVVNTGLFPISIEGARLVSGQDAVVHVTAQNASGYFTVVPTLALGLVGQLILLAVCLIPLILSLFVRGVEPEPAAAPASGDDSGVAARPSRFARARTRLATVLAERSWLRPALLSTLVAGFVAFVMAITQTMTLASYGATIRNSTNSAGSRTYFTCATAVTSGSPVFAYALGKSGLGTEQDLTTNNNDGTFAKSSTISSSYGCLRDTPKASVTFNGTSQCVYSNVGYTNATAPNTFSLEAWFSTTSVSNGKIIGYGSVKSSSADGNYDRHIYLDKAGRVVFGVYPNTLKAVASPAGTSYADGKWHHVIATLSSAGMALYLDGNLVASDSTTTTAEPLSGYWKVGCGKLITWLNGDGTNYDGPYYFTGSIQYAAVYSTALTAPQAKEHYLAGVS
jgi:signal peptidase I